MILLAAVNLFYRYNLHIDVIEKNVLVIWNHIHTVLFSPLFYVFQSLSLSLSLFLSLSLSLSFFPSLSLYQVEWPTAPYCPLVPAVPPGDNCIWHWFQDLKVSSLIIRYRTFIQCTGVQYTIVKYTRYSLKYTLDLRSWTVVHFWTTHIIFLVISSYHLLTVLSPGCTVYSVLQRMSEGQRMVVSFPQLFMYGISAVIFLR